MCGGLLWHSTSTTVEPSFIAWEGKYSSNPKKLPNRKEKHAITKRECQDLLRSIDTNAFQAVPQVAGCRPCRDLPESWLVVKYSDGTKISVIYGAAEPAPVKVLKFPALQITFSPR